MQLNCIEKGHQATKKIDEYMESQHTQSVGKESKQKELVSDRCSSQYEDNSQLNCMRRVTNMLDEYIESQDTKSVGRKGKQKELVSGRCSS